MPDPQEHNGAVLQIRGLRTHFFLDVGVARAVDGVSLDIPAGKTVALVGESGCGKSVTALSILRLIPEPPGRIVDGEILFRGQNLLALSKRAMRKLRGNAVSMIFQEPATSLNPVFRVGNQLIDVMRLHRGYSRTEARQRAIALLRQVGIPAPEERVDDYPHQMSGGMRQRAMIAMALACDPVLLIADEPTTALDVTVQAQILDLLKAIQAERGLSILLITHDLGIVAETAHEVAVMYAGQIVEHAPVRDLFARRKHPYTVGLFESLPKLHGRHERLYTIKGQVPPATRFPEGCRFHDRCPHAMDVCREQTPVFEQPDPAHPVACWLYDVPTMTAQGRPTGIPPEEQA